MKMKSDLRKYKRSGARFVAWKEIAKKRSAVEKVNVYLKEFIQLNNVRHRTGLKTNTHLNLVTLVYNCTKLVNHRLNSQLQLQVV